MNQKAGPNKFLRIDNWWSSKAALLMGFVYLYAAWFQIPFPKMLFLSLLSASTVSGFAAVGYLCNDFFDREKDAVAGKRNFLLGKPVTQIFLLFTLSAGLLIIPWLHLPFTKISALLIVIELLLFLFYSVKPFRLKERGLAGVFADALYAHALPALLSVYTFSLASEKSIETFPLICLLLWQFASGLRNILLHQNEDKENDKLADVKNYASTISAPTFKGTIKLLIGLEVVFSVLLYLFLAKQNSLLAGCALLVLFFTVMVSIIFYNPGFETLLETRLRFFPNTVFEKWLPVAVLLVLAAADLRFLALALLHITLFNFEFYYQVKHLFAPSFNRLWHSSINLLVYRLLIPFRILISRMLNYFIYYSLLLFNIDLKKEQTSALQYFKTKFAKK